MMLVLKLAGSAFAVGAVLFFTRMAPVFAVLPDDMPFPPSSVSDTVRLVEIAGIRWRISHAMGLIAASLFIAGYWGHARVLARAGRNHIATIAAIVATLSFCLFSAALVIDGFLLSAAANAHASGGANAPLLAEVAAIHDRALVFFTPGVFLMFIAMGVLSSRLLHGLIHSRWLGFLGMTVAIAGPTAYLFGLAGPNWNNLRIGGSLMMAAFLWHFLVGVAAFFGKHHDKTQSTAAI